MTLNEINEIIKQWRRESPDKRAILIISSEVTGEDGQHLQSQHIDIRGK